MVYKDLQRNFFPILRRKVVASEPRPRIEPYKLQPYKPGLIQPGRSYALVKRTESKLSITNQNNQEIQEKMISKFGTIYNKRYTEITI